MRQKNLKAMYTTEELARQFKSPYTLVHRAIEMARDAIHNGYAVKSGDYKNLAHQVLQGIFDGRTQLDRPVIIEEEEEEFIEEEELEPIAEMGDEEEEEEEEEVEEDEEE
jgi:hypothetical protein